MGAYLQVTRLFLFLNRRHFIRVAFVPITLSVPPLNFPSPDELLSVRSPSCSPIVSFTLLILWFYVYLSDLSLRGRTFRGAYLQGCAAKCSTTDSGGEPGFPAVVYFRCVKTPATADFKTPAHTTENAVRKKCARLAAVSLHHVTSTHHFARFFSIYPCSRKSLCINAPLLSALGRNNADT